MPRRPQRLLAAVVAGSALLGGLSLASVLTPELADAATPLTGFYLALGGSESLGFQPDGDGHAGAPTVDGYANDLVAYEAERGVTLDLTQLGCPGETTATMISGADGCYHSVGSQLESAVNFLASHQSEPGIVTIDLGFNNVLTCLRRHDDGCLAARLASVSQQLSTIVGALQSAAGPEVTFVGIDHYDPFLATARDGDRWARARRSEDVIAALNETINDVYSGARIAVAKVGETFQMHDHELVAAGEGGSEPIDVERVCEWTWMCAAPPEGPNLHPNDAGYVAIASAIEAVLPSPW